MPEPLVRDVKDEVILEVEKEGVKEPEERERPEDWFREKLVMAVLLVTEEAGMDGVMETLDCSWLNGEAPCDNDIPPGAMEVEGCLGETDLAVTRGLEGTLLGAFRLMRSKVDSFLEESGTLAGPGERERGREISDAS